MNKKHERRGEKKETTIANDKSVRNVEKTSTNPLLVTSRLFQLEDEIRLRVCGSTSIVS